MTRRVIDAFPEQNLISYSVVGMRPFAQMVKEMIDISDPGIGGIVSGNGEDVVKWDHSLEKSEPKTKQDLLNKWDEVTEKINRLWPQIFPQRFRETDMAFGQYENRIYASIFYFIDNEILHTGQAYVYLGSLGIEPPPFWEH